MLVLKHDIPRGHALLTDGVAPDDCEIVQLCALLHARPMGLGEPVGDEGHRRLLRPIAIDVGANMGTHTLAFSRYCDMVYSFEPQPVLYEIMSYNVARNQARAAPFPLAVGRVDGTTWMPTVDYRQRRDYGMIQCQPEDVENGVQRHMVALDSFATHIHRIDLIKIDVEGMESSVLTGAEHLIRQHRPILFVEWMRSDRAALEQQLRDLGYRDIRQVGINLLAQ